MECLGHRSSRITVLEGRVQTINSKEDMEIILRVLLCFWLEIQCGFSVGCIGSPFQSPGPQCHQRGTAAGGRYRQAGRESPEPSNTVWVE